LTWHHWISDALVAQSGKGLKPMITVAEKDLRSFIYSPPRFRFVQVPDRYKRPGDSTARDGRSVSTDTPRHVSGGRSRCQSPPRIPCALHCVQANLLRSVPVCTRRLRTTRAEAGISGDAISGAKRASPGWSGMRKWTRPWIQKRNARSRAETARRIRKRSFILAGCVCPSRAK
jgi:hypothetical protein